MRKPRLGALGVLVLALALGAGCGRKLPPLPPGMPDPVSLVSARFVGEAVEVKARCTLEGGVVSLVGKPQGICPSCTDDLAIIDEQPVEEAGTLVLKDPAPGAPSMVYRLVFRKGTFSSMTEARIVRRD